MADLTKNWYDGRLDSGTSSPGGAQKYWYDGQSVAEEIQENGVIGAAGITSEEAFGAGGLVAGPITGSAGIPSAEAFGTGALGLVAALVNGTAGIASEEAFGAGGVVCGPVSGTAGIVSGEAFSEGVVAGPITGDAGIASAEAFGAGGLLAVTQPLEGAAGIASGEAFGTPGYVSHPILGTAGIDSAEAFGSGGRVGNVATGYLGMRSAEAFGLGGAVLANDAATCFFDGFDRTAWVSVSQDLKVTAEMSGRARATLSLEIPAGARWRPRLGMEVEYFWGTRKMFAGFIQEVTIRPTWGARKQAGRLPCVVDVSLVDYCDLLDRRVVTRRWAGPTLNLVTIVTEIVRDFLDGEGVSFAASEDMTLSNQGDLVLEGETVYDSFQRVGAVFGCDWRIDFFRMVWFERRVVRPAPRTLEDYNGAWDWITSLRKTRAQLRNRQGVIGGQPGAGQRTKQFTELTGLEWDFLVGESITAAPTVDVNDTPAVVVLTSLTSTTDWDFSYTIGDSTVYANRAKAAPTGTVAITYPSKGAIDITWQEDSADIARRRRLEPRNGSGVYEAVRRVRNARTLEAMDQIALVQVQRQGADQIELVFTSRSLGWEVGQMVVVNVENPRYAGSLIVRGASYELIDRTFWLYTVTAASMEAPKILGVARQPGATEYTVDRGVYDPYDYTTTDFGDGAVDLTTDSSIIVRDRHDIIAVWFNGDRSVMYLLTREPHGLVEDQHFQIQSVESPFHMLNGSYQADTGTGTLAGTGHGNGTGTDVVVLKHDETPATTPGFEANPDQTFVVSGTVSLEDPLLVNIHVVGDDLILTTAWDHGLNPDDHFGVAKVLAPFNMVNGRRYTAGAATGGTDVYLAKKQAPRTTPGLYGNAPATFVTGGWVFQDEFVDDGSEANGGPLDGAPTIIAIRFLPNVFVLNTDGPMWLFAGVPFEISGVRAPYQALNGRYEGPFEDAMGTTLIMFDTAIPEAVPRDTSLFQPGGYIRQADPMLLAAEKITFSGQDYLRLTLSSASGLGADDPFRCYGVLAPYTGLNGRTFQAHALTADDLVYIPAARVPSSIPEFGSAEPPLFNQGGWLHNMANDEPTWDPNDPRGPGNGTHIAISDIRAYGTNLVITTATEHGVIAGDRIDLFDVPAPFDMCNLSFVTVAIDGKKAVGPAADIIIIPGTQTDPTTPGLHGNPSATFVVGGYLVNQSASSLETNGDNGGIFSGTGGEGSDGLGTADPPLIPIAVDVNGQLQPVFTTNRDHGLTSSTPGGGGDEVSIHGCNEDPGVYNTSRSRITVTGARTFAATDNQVRPGRDPFQATGRGRIYRLGAVPRPVGGGDEVHDFVLGLRADTLDDENQIVDKATFVLANAIPGFASQPLRVMDNVTNSWVAQADTAVITSVTAQFKDPPVGGQIAIDIKKNGTSIFSNGFLIVTEADGENVVSVDSGFADARINRNDVVTLDIKEVGQERAGCNGTVVLTMK